MPVPDEPTTAGAATMNAILRAPARRGATVYAGREPDRTTTNADAVAAVRAALAGASDDDRQVLRRALADELGGAS